MSFVSTINRWITMGFKFSLAKAWFNLIQQHDLNIIICSWHLSTLAGTQLPLCKESCGALDKINDQCHWQFNAIKRNTNDFFDYLYKFNCSSPESYLLPGLPPDTEKCLQMEDFCKFSVPIHTWMLYIVQLCSCCTCSGNSGWFIFIFSWVETVHKKKVELIERGWTFVLVYILSLSPSPANVVALVVSVITSLCLMIAVCLIIVLVCIFNRTKMKTYFRRWTFSTSQGWAHAHTWSKFGIVIQIFLKGDILCVLLMPVNVWSLV